MLPKLKGQSGPGRITVGAFGGLDRRPGAGPGAVAAMENLCAAAVPALTTRPARQTLRALNGTAHGVFAVGDTLLSAEGTALYANDVAVTGTLSDTDKVFAALGERVLIFPDKRLWTAAGGLEPLEASYTAAGLVFSDGTYAGAAAERNTVTTAGDAFPFRIGDAVTFPACAPTGNVEKTAVVREMSADGRQLRFYENCFEENGTVSASLTLRRSVPDLDFLCVNENRVWGCRGDTVCCCKPGDPYNWNVFDGLSTDAWQCDTGTAGAFTGCVSYLGYPVFFKEERIFKVYGDRPTNFELMSSATRGVRAGAAASLAVAGETLHYLARDGFVRYGGGLPQSIDAALSARYSAAAGGSDGRRYCVSALRGDGERELLVLDAETGAWHREDTLAVKAFANLAGTLVAQTADKLIAAGAGVPDGPSSAAAVGNAVLSVPSTRNVIPSAVEGSSLRSAAAGEDPSTSLRSAQDDSGGETESFTASVTLSDLAADLPASKYPTRLWLRLDNTDALTAAVSYDGGDFVTAATVPAGHRSVRGFPLPLRRCDRFSLRLTGPAPWTLHGLAIETRTEGTRRK
jgi:hypothetical protein